MSSRYTRLEDSDSPSSSRNPSNPRSSIITSHNPSPSSSSSVTSTPPTYSTFGSTPARIMSAEQQKAGQIHRNSADVHDPQAPWFTHLEYSVDVAEWDDDRKYPNCPLCRQQFVGSLMGSGKHHCRACGVLCCSSCSKGSLELPGYRGNERVCDGCRKKVLQLRAYINTHEETLINNVPANTQAVKFHAYVPGKVEPYETELWLSQTLLLFMYKDVAGQMQGLPVHTLKEVTEGFSSPELEGRTKKTVMCCCSGQDELFLKKKERLFSIVTQDGKTFDFEAPSTQTKAEWVSRIRGLIDTCGPFVDYHFKVAHYDVFDLLKKEKFRLSPENIKRLRDEKRAEARAQKSAEAERIKNKYGR